MIELNSELDKVYKQLIGVFNHEVEIDKVVDADSSIGNIDASKKPPGINIRKGDEIIGYPIF